MPVPDAWAAQDQAVVGQARPAEWRQFFRAPALTALIEAALGNNRDLRIAVWRVEVARSQYRSQRADRFPHVNVGAAALRTQIPASLSVTGETYTANLYGGIIGASWDIDLWGRVRNLDAAALDNWMATQEGRRSITLCLIAEVANNWLTARELDERIALADRTVTSRRDSARIARRRFEVGAAPRIDQVREAMHVDDTLLFTGGFNFVRRHVEDAQLIGNRVVECERAGEAGVDAKEVFHFPILLIAASVICFADSVRSSFPSPREA